MFKITGTVLLKGVSLVLGLGSVIVSSMLEARVQRETKEELKNELLNEFNKETEED